jgi:bifunctional enzyme CysN/CysC
MRERLSVVVAGDVDCGKSTVVGRLLLDSGTLPRGRLERARDLCAKEARRFEYAYLIDALRQEQADNMTLDVARVFLKGARRDYLLLDAPGHFELLRNMATGASHAEAAVWVVSAVEGLGENSRRHGRLLSLFGIRQAVVLVNKMDAAGYDRGAFERLARGCLNLLKSSGVSKARCVPMAAFEGENVVQPGLRMPWYRGPTVLNAIDEFDPEPPDSIRAFRMPVQDIYPGVRRDAGRPVIVGTVESGSVGVGDEIVFYPSRKFAEVRSIETYPRIGLKRAERGMAIGLTLDRLLKPRRGETAARAREKAPETGRKLLASLLWLGPSVLKAGGRYFFRLGTSKIPARLERVVRVVEAATLRGGAGRRDVRPNEAAECVLRLEKPAVFDLAAENPSASRFVLVDGSLIGGGGFVRAVIC